MTANLDRPIEAVIRHGKIEPLESLDLPDETRVQVMITSTQPAAEVEPEITKSYRHLQQAGLLDRVPDPSAAPSWKLHPPTEIPGVPLSQIIIDMRDPDAEW